MPTPSTTHAATWSPRTGRTTPAPPRPAACGTSPRARCQTRPPPAGGTIATTYTDARGRVTEIDQYHPKTSASGAYATATYGYSYISGGSTKTVTDAGGNTWTWTYDLLGRVVSAANPDTGTTTSTYGDLGQLTSATDAAGKTISWAYDAAGRKTAEYAAAAGSQSGSNELAAWTYDSVKAGQLSSATSYTSGTGGEAYKETINSYDAGYRPTSTTYTIPSDSVTGSLAGSYTLTASYDLDGTPATVGYPAAGPLAAETVNFGYDNKGSPYSEWSSSGADAANNPATEADPTGLPPPVLPQLPRPVPVPQPRQWRRQRARACTDQPARLCQRQRPWLLTASHRVQWAGLIRWAAANQATSSV